MISAPDFGFKLLNLYPCMHRRALIGATLAGLIPACATPAIEPGMRTRRFAFVSNGKRLVGFLDMPTHRAARAMIVIAHGYGQTDVAGRTSYYDLRSRFTALGIATVIWDKPGCGESEGVFDANQTVASSAQEVRDAVRGLRERGAPGARKIGIWGISRAGWIAPLAIARDRRIAFWISVSGTDDKESFGYLLENNLRIEGRGEAEIAALVSEWRRGFEITRSGGTFADYLAATKNLRRDSFMAYLGSETSEAEFLSYQPQVSSAPVDPETGLQIYVPGFAETLSSLNIPVLALFGEKDTSVDWRSTAALYQRTIGANPRARLTVRTFADGNHNLQQAATGGLREMIEMRERRASVGYSEAMEDWLRTEVLHESRHGSAPSRRTMRSSRA